VYAAVYAAAVAVAVAAAVEAAERDIHCASAGTGGSVEAV
jgi:hypothetical protein